MKRFPSILPGLAAALLLLCVTPSLAAGEAVGYWKGTLAVPQAELEIAVDLQKGEDGGWSGTIDIPMQGVRGQELGDISVDAENVKFLLAGMPGNPTFQGTLSEDGGKIIGHMWQAGQTFPFTLSRAEAPEGDGEDVYAEYTAPGTPGEGAAGSWLGLLESGPMRLRLKVTVTSAEDGSLNAVMQSPDQGNVELPADSVTLEGKAFSFKIGRVQGSFAGALNDDGSAVEGTWTQGPNALPLVLRRQP